MRANSHVLTPVASAVTNRRPVQPQAPSAPLPANHWPNPLLARTLSAAAPDGTAFLLTDLNWKPIYTNEAAAFILRYPDHARAKVIPGAVQDRIRAIFQAKRFTQGLRPVSFLSGRRHYVCRPFPLESRSNGTRSPIVALALERRPRDRMELTEVFRQFRLSPREVETVQYLILGLTTKEVAQRMGISPNTVKQFVRLIMSKMAVTKRAGIIGKLLRG